MSSEVETDVVTVDDQAISEVFEPASVAELQELLSGSALPDALVISSGRTRLAFGNESAPFDGALSLRRLNRVIHYEPDDMTMAVEPGCTIADIHAVLAKHHQAIAIDTSHSDRATVGGSFATGMSSPRRLGGGSLKDWVIGIEVVSPDGTLVRAGGMVVKNVTGFDMMHVHYGALGAFGVVTRLNLKVFPRMSTARSVMLRFADVDAAHAAGSAILRSQLQPTSLVLSGKGAEWTVSVRSDAPESAIDRVVERVVDVGSSAVKPLDVQTDLDPDVALGSYTRVTDLGAGRGVVRMPLTATHQLPVLRALEAANSYDICADLGSGLIYAAGEPDEAWMRRVEALHPAPTFLSLPVALKRGIDVFGAFDPAATDIVRRMKATYDPTGRFNRGRFVAHL